MYDQKQALENRYVNKRLGFATIKKRKSELNLDDFDNLLDFNGHKTIKVYCDRHINDDTYSKEIMVLLKQNFLTDKKDGVSKKHLSIQKNVNNNIDFSIFDNLLNDVDEKLGIKEKRLEKKISLNIPEAIEYLKKDIRYYEKKIDYNYKLDNLEIEEARLFSLKNKLNELKDKMSFVRKSSLESLDNTKNNDILSYCQKEIQKIEDDINGKKVTPKDDEKTIDTSEKNVKEIEKRINDASLKIKTKIHLCMLKRMVFNLFKMTVGVYLTNVSKHDGLKIMVGSFLVVNSVSGIKEAISFKEKREKYYQYSDYTKTRLSKYENISLASNLLDKAVTGIDELKKEFKKNFQHFKEYIDDYEEIYFKFDKLKEIIMYKQYELCELSMKKNSKAMAFNI